MLDAYIIEELKRREREEEGDERRPELQIPEAPLHQRDEEKPQRAVVIIDYSV